MSQEHSVSTHKTDPDSGSPKKTSWLGLFIILALLGGGVASAMLIVQSAPRPERVKPEIKPRLVEIVPISTSSNRPMWQAGGEVEAVEQVALKPRVAGYVSQINPDAVPGALLTGGTELAKLDDDDFKLALAQQQAAVDQARADVAIKQGDVAVAQEEYALVAANLPAADRALVLKQPQLEKAKATLESQKAALKSARLDLSRATITMPFDGQVISRSVSRGSQVSTSSELFELVDTSRFWVRVKVPASFLNWLDSASPVTISHPAWGSATRTGQVVSSLPGVAESDRQAQVLVAVNDPLDLAQSGQPKLLLNDFVTVELQGRSLANTVTVPLTQLEDDDSIWVVNDAKLTRRELNVMYRGRKLAWVSNGFEAGDQLLANRLDGVVEGQPVRIEQNEQVATEVAR